MKSYIAIMYFVLLILLTADLFAQRNYEPVTQDSGVVTSDAFSVDDGWYFGGLRTPDLATDNDTIFFLVSHDASTYDTLRYQGSIYYEQIDTLSHNLTLDFKQVYIWEWWKIVTENKPVEDKTWIPYKIKMN